MANRDRSPGSSGASRLAKATLDAGPTSCSGRFVRLPMLAVGVASLGLLLSFSSHAHSQCSELAPESDDALLRELATEDRKARTWRYVWTGLNAGGTALSLAALPVLPKSDRPDLLIGAATSAVSAAVTWLWPLDVEADAEAALRTRCWPAPQRTAELLRLREHSARDEAERVRWPWHVGNFVTSLIPGTILWFGFHDHVNGALSAAGSFASGEIELLTQPTHLADTPSPPIAGGAVGSALTRGGALLTYQASW